MPCHALQVERHYGAPGGNFGRYRTEMGIKGYSSFESGSCLLGGKQTYVNAMSSQKSGPMPTARLVPSVHRSLVCLIGFDTR